MRPHPLTPRKPKGTARVAGLASALAITASAFCAVNSVVPATAWLPALDRPRPADLELLAEIVRSAAASGLDLGDPVGSLLALLQAPVEVIRTFVRLDIGSSMAIRGGAALFCGWIVGSRVTSGMLAATIPEPAVAHVKGPRLLTGRAALGALKAAWSLRFRGAASGVELADGLALPRPLEAEHILVVGGTGAGKTTILQALMDSAIRLGDRILALDVKGDVTARLPTDGFSLFALGDSRSARWDVGRDIRTYDDATELAIELIAETSDPAWSAGARRVLATLVLHLQRQSRERGTVWTWIDLDRLLAKPIEELHALILPIDPATAAFIDATRPETLKQAMSFYLVLVANAGQVVHACAAMGWRGRGAVSIRNWVAGRGNPVLILRQSQTRPELSASLVRTVLKVVADAAVDRSAEEAPQPLWLFLDELAQIGLCAAVPRLTAVGRSAGVRVVAAIQSPAQLRDVYGSDAAQALLDTLTTKIVGRVAAGATAEDISSRWIGERTIAWWDDSGTAFEGQPRRQQHVQDVRVVEAATLSDDLGLGVDAAGRPVIRALVLGHGDIARLSWRVGRWPLRRQATIQASTLARSAPGPKPLESAAGSEP